MCLPYNQIWLGSKRNPIVQVWEKSTRKVLRKICKRLILLATIALCRRTLKSSCQERKKMPSPREQVKHQSIKISWNIFFLSTAGDWRNCSHRGCCWWLLLLQEVSWSFSNCVGSLKRLWKDFDFTEADVQEGCRPCAWAHWGWFTQWLEGGWGQGQLEVGQLRGLRRVSPKMRP